MLSWSLCHSRSKSYKTNAVVKFTAPKSSHGVVGVDVVEVSEYGRAYYYGRVMLMVVRVY